MGNSKKSASKSKSQARREAVQNSDAKVEARPIGEGKDPLAEGATLHNPTNSEGETHYEADTSELDAEATAAENRIGGQDANQRAEQHNAESDVLPHTANPEQDEVAANRVDDTAQATEVPERTEEQEQADSEDRQEAVNTAMETTDKPQ